MRRGEQPGASEEIIDGVHIMSEAFIVTRLAQGVLAVTIVFAIAAAMQFSLVT
jgi:hypothetical protein